MKPIILITPTQILIQALMMMDHIGNMHIIHKDNSESANERQYESTYNSFPATYSEKQTPEAQKEATHTL